MTQSVQPVPASDQFPDELPKQHEIVCGRLVRKAMPSVDHGDLSGELRAQLRAFRGRRRTPGGWWFSNDCEIEPFPDEQPVERYLPDIVGWKISVVSEKPSGVRVSTWPQWVCEILSPSTAADDKSHKLDAYHRMHVDHYWLVDPEERTLTVMRWGKDGYPRILFARADERVRAEPFDAIELDLTDFFDCE